jgi:uncharacterized glyoxalase superfamily protein PhnB
LIAPFAGATLAVLGEAAVVYLWTDDVRSLHDELSSRGADILHPPTERPWGMLEIRVRDLNGYVLGFGQPIG